MPSDAEWSCSPHPSGPFLYENPREKFVGRSGITPKEYLFGRGIVTRIVTETEPLIILLSPMITTWSVSASSTVAVLFPSVRTMPAGFHKGFHA